MSRLIRLLILFVVISWLFRQTAELRESWEQARHNPRWRVIEDELRGAGDDALNWTEETLREHRLRE